MKNVPYSYQIIAILAAVSFFIPLFIVLVKRLQKYRPLIWLTMYWTVAGFVNLLFMIEALATSRLMAVVERVYNLADAPFMLFIFYHSVQVEKIRYSIKKMLPAYIAASLAITFFTWMPQNAEAFMVGCGLIIILIYILWIIAHYITNIKLKPIEEAMQFIYYALLFEYGISVVTFVFNYIIPERRNVEDSFLIYHLSVIVAVIVASYGLIGFKEKAKKGILKVAESKPKLEAEIKFL